MDVMFKEKKRDFDEKCNEFNRLNNYNEQCKRDIENLGKKKYDVEVEIGECKAKLREYEKRNKDLNRQNNGLSNDKDRITREKKDAEHEKFITKAGVNALTREIEYLRKQTDNEKTNILALIRNRDMMSKYIKKAEIENLQNKKDLNAKVNEISSLKEQGRSKQEHIHELLKQIFKLEKERDKFSHEASKANANLMQMVEEVKLKQNLISELKKENIEFEGKLKQQQNLYEAVRSDRNLYSKNLIEANDEVAQLRRNFKQASLQIHQLKEDIETKDQAVTEVSY